MYGKLCGAQVHVQEEAAAKEAEAKDPEDKLCRMFFCNVVAALPSRLAVRTTKRMLL